MNKNKVLETVNGLPQNFDVDVLIEKLIFIENVEKGLEQLNSDNILTHDQVKQKVREWQK